MVHIAAEASAGVALERSASVLNVEALPPLCRPEHERCYAEPIGDAERQFCDDWRGRYFKAWHAAMDFARASGADGFSRPFSLNDESCHVGALYFERKPDKAGWTAGRPTRGRYHATLAKGVGGEAARAAMAELPPFPGYHEIDDFAGLITDLSYDYDGGWTTGGIDRHGLNVGQLAWTCRQRTFLCFPNPFCSIVDALSRHPDAKFRGDTDPCAWRLRDGWRLVSKAEQALAFAEDAVTAEREAADSKIGGAA